MLPLLRVAFVTFVILVIAEVVAFGGEFLAVDSCLDKGGSFDYTTGKCDNDRNHPFIPYRTRHPFAIPLLVCGCVGSVGCSVALRKLNTKTSHASTLDDATRANVAEALENLAAQDVWDDEVWRRCHDLVSENMTRDDLLAYVYDDLIHYTGRRLLRSAPIPADFNAYRQEFRDVAEALRSRLALQAYKTRYE